MRDVVENGEAVEQQVELEGPDDATLGDTVRSKPGHILALERKPVLGSGSEIRVIRLNKVVFPEPFGSDDAEDFAFVDVKVELVDGVDAAEALLQGAGLK